jgi:hypothetical protein
MEDKKETPKKRKDSLFPVKYIGYCWSQLPPGDTDMHDFLNYCRFQLCKLSHRLMKDPIWETYTSEELLAEFYAHTFAKDKDFLKQFEMFLANEGGEILEFDAWADMQIKKSQEEKSAKAKKLEDSVAFSPEDVMGEG